MNFFKKPKKRKKGEPPVWSGIKKALHGQLCHFTFRGDTLVVGRIVDHRRGLLEIETEDGTYVGETNNLVSVWKPKSKNQANISYR